MKVICSNLGCFHANTFEKPQYQYSKEVLSKTTLVGKSKFQFDFISLVSAMKYEAKVNTRKLDKNLLIFSRKDARLEEKASEFQSPTKLKFSITEDLEEKIHEAVAEYDS